MKENTQSQTVLPAQKAQITASSKQIIYGSLKVVLMTIIISLLVNFSLRIDFMYLEVGLGERSITESLQLTMLLITTISFFRLSQKSQTVSHAAILITGFFAALLIREMDYWFDIIRHGSWVYPALLVSVLACFKAYQGGKNTVNQMADLLREQSMQLLIVAVILLLVFSRVYGMGSFWRHVMAEHFVHDVKNIAEEGIELLCYSLIAFSSIATYRKVMR
ncbi:hypothetical protein BS333_20145 [Vibrio azureus]|uniref:Uncharacterized protein n=1 Tax=Vibrio azureus NBRC 104587 TaxID=1219077 RepID=U3AVJ2_9VIBR|nr:hypothetical protein [Vibrio azureus]AUI88617.1 hypothetical protein BS333_20145 [Vibrio azureus]GAD77247.1 hypothetical protein VAZ01S_067_00060 [Vibrio azureus NBRC 104587]